MSVRASVLVPPAAGGEPSAPPADGPRAPGALDGLLGTAPSFRGALRGYDRIEVDNYVAWAEAELDLARRESEHLFSRFSVCSAELVDVRRRLARLIQERADEDARGDQAQELLVRAAGHAAAITAAAEAEAQRIHDAARAEAEARLANVAELRVAAVAVRDQAEQRLAAERRERAAAESAAAERIAALAAEAAQLRAERDRARESLAELHERIGCALQVVTAGLPGEERHSDAP
ncbi:hypothetical protein [Blastococcus sp. TF02A-26]|uniref:hypothetical protein n=1 Tax=Blastococcus sp. TF02A-26 TaxID=2250577 RepID=UPI000DEB6462|nr:hypothetical protein [Blastococcus sp. TF02A-26]RBY90757.1 hypothetical protein DQ240_01495 [Blastococcus sp. TF02A-26]